MPELILSTAYEVVPLRDTLDLHREGMIEAVRYAESQRALWTANEPRGHDLITMNAKSARRLREIFCGSNWERDETDNQAGIIHTGKALRVITCNFDQFAGNRHRTPTNLVAKGEGSCTKTRCNATGWLPGLEDVRPQTGSNITTWILASYSDDKEPLR